MSSDQDTSASPDPENESVDSSETVSADGPADETSNSDPGGRAALVRALNVVDNAKRGFAFGLVFATVVFLFFVVDPGTNRSPFLFLGLGFVLATTVGMLATALLTAASAYRLSKDL